MKRFLPFALLLVIAAPAIAATPPTTAAPAPAASVSIAKDFETGRFARVKALHDPLIKGAVPTWYTPGYKQHARKLQRFMTGERAFVKRELGVEVPLSLAVLDPGQWKRVERQIPFPVPSVDGQPSVALLPADWAAAPRFFPKRKDIDPAVMKAVLARGVSWDEATYRAADLIGGHELGHTVEHVYGIEPGTNWLNEFLANYVLYAYLQHDRRDLLRLYSLLVSINRLDQPQPYVSLEDFESRYMQIMTTEPSNYGWYQGQFMTLAQRVYAAQGVDFLRKVRAAFPPGPQRFALGNAETLRRLEKINPGFIAWAQAMAAKPRVAHH